MSQIEQPKASDTPKVETNSSHATSATLSISDLANADGSNVTSTQSCRMYENKFPEVDDLVMVRVKSIDEMGAYVSLLEYNNIEGMILLSELSRRRIRSIGKLLRVGRQETVVVLRVDKDKGYIDLSKRRVSPEEIVQCEEKFTKSKTVHSIMRHIAEIMHQNLEELYVKFGWPLYKKFGHAFDGFKKAIADPDSIFQGVDFTPDLKDAFVKIIQRRLAPQPTKIRADLEVTCFHYEGIDAIKEALTLGQKCSKPAVTGVEKDADGKEPEGVVTIKLVAPPLYVMVTTSLEKEKGIQALNNSIEVVRKVLLEKKGEVIVKVAPRAVSEREDRELTNYMEELERQNMEVSGDDDNEDNEGTESNDEGEPVKGKTRNEEEADDNEDDDEEGEEEEPKEVKGKQAKPAPAPKGKATAKPAKSAQNSTKKGK